MWCFPDVLDYNSPLLQSGCTLVWIYTDSSAHYSGLLAVLRCYPTVIAPHCLEGHFRAISQEKQDRKTTTSEYLWLKKFTAFQQEVAGHAPIRNEAVCPPQILCRHNPEGRITCIYRIVYICSDNKKSTWIHNGKDIWKGQGPHFCFLLLAIESKPCLGLQLNPHYIYILLGYGGTTALLSRLPLANRPCLSPPSARPWLLL